MRHQITAIRSKLFVVSGFLVVSCAILVVFVILLDDLKEARTLWKTYHAIPQIHDEWWRVYENVFSITRDNILLEHTVGTKLGGGRADCTISSSWKIYGTDQSFKEVVDNYTTVLADRGWGERTSPPGDNTIVYYFNIKNAQISIWDRSTCCQSNYTTIYELQLIYMEPSYLDCVNY